MTSSIHSTAVVDASARLGAEVSVGPYAIIEAGCAIGRGCEIRAHAIVCAGTTMGEENQIGYGAVLGAEPQDISFRGHASSVIIGARNRIREYVTIHRSARESGATKIGDDNFLMAGSHLGHDVQLGNNVVLANHALLGGYAQVGDGVFLGGATLVHQHGRIGRLAMTRGGTPLSKDLPPYFMAVAVNQVSGINRVGLRRAGFSAELRRAVQDAYRLIYRSGLNIGQAVEEIRVKFPQPEITHLVDFISTSKRGICRERTSRGGDEDDNDD